MTISPEIGLFSLCIALIFALLQSITPLLKNEKLGRIAAICSFAFTALSFLLLMNAFYMSDFSVALAANHSLTTQPLIYKLTSVWGNHEGSMLLWVLILTLFSAALALFGKSFYTHLALSMQGLMSFAFIGFTLFTSNPFARLFPVPLEGKDLNPVLQDLGLAIHPPMLYIGYVGFSAVFSFAAAALISGRITSEWAKAVRPWLLVAWVFLTLGIAMGSFWAYYELGWGGWWFWDPVENASFMPWLVGTALLHSTIVMEKREGLKIWTILLAILTFSFSLLGTFLVRSGVLTSVHSFASDPQRGLVILGLLVFFIGGALALFAFRASSLKAGGAFRPVSREGAIVFNNLFLTVSATAILFGTLYPLILESLTDIKISVGAPYFNMVFLPLILPILLLIPAGTLMPWKKADWLVTLKRLIAAFIVGVLIWAFTGAGAIIFALGGYIIVGSLTDLANRKFKSGFAPALAHAGVGVMLLGITGESLRSYEVTEKMVIGQAIKLGDKELVYVKNTSLKGANFNELAAHIDVREGGVVTATLNPAKRLYTARGMATTEAALKTHIFSQTYLSVAEFEEGGIILRAYEKPLVLLIWLGAFIMAMGGALALFDKRGRK
jgi:cytochrome c-type biogenesis protein CcmF